MPDRSRHARRQPPSITDHILSHPCEVALAVWWVLLGAAIAVGLIPGAPDISRVVDNLPLPVALALAVSVGVGGGLALVGVTWPGERLSTAWRIERTGLLLAASGWAAYLVIIATAATVSTFTASMAATMIVAAVLRLIALHGVEADTRAVVAQAGMDL